MVNQEIINFANHLADISAAVIKKYFRKNFAESKKADDTPVTKADRETEEAICKAILAQFPDHGIIGEEFGNVNESAKFKWVIDPIDGTISFVMGRPIFGTLIALTYEDKPVLGIINQPITGERWLGVNDGQQKFATLNGQKITTKNCQKLSDAVFCSTSPFFFTGQNKQMIQKIASQTKYQSQGGIIYGGDCYLFGLLAAGGVDLIIETGLKNFDFAALAPIIQGAGGIVTDWKGQELTTKSDGTIIASSGAELHRMVLGQMD